MKKTTLLILLLLCGCVQPFTVVKYVPLNDITPPMAQENFSNNFAQKFTLLNSIVFKYSFFKVAALGYTQVDALNEKFNVTGFNPAGLKLFDIHGQGKNICGNFVFKQMARGGDVVKAIGQDIERIYFNCLPQTNATAKQQRYKIIFNEPFENGVLEHVFAGEQANLIEKSYYENKRLQWRIFYYNYRKYNEKLYPMAVMFKNYKYHYKLIVRTKEIYY